MTYIATRLFKKAALLGLFTCIALIPATIATAAANTPQPVLNNPEKSALAISPAIIEQVTAPGNEKKITLKVTNLTDFPLPISGTVKNFLPLEEVIDKSKTAAFDASKWFKLSEPDFILQPKQTKEIVATILPPANAEAGGHYATIYFQPLLPEGSLTPSTAYLSARVGSLAFLIVPGDIEERLTVKKFETSKLHLMAPIDFSLETLNSGNIHISPTTLIEIFDWRGKKVDETQAQPGITVPGTQKTQTISLRNLPLFGRYTAVATTSFGANEKKTQSSTTFWVIPWVMVLFTPLILLVVIIGLRTRGRWKKAWKILVQRQ